MFTGIIERTARVTRLVDRPGSRIIELLPEENDKISRWHSADLGESIAVNGVCLTVVCAMPLRFEAVPETLSKTTLGKLAEGERVNLERSLAAGDRFGGHYVTGHVDGVGEIRAVRPVGDQLLFEISASRALLRQMIPKGSIAVDGTSLTLIDVDRLAHWFSFAAIPHTVERTVLSQRGRGSLVNLETDAFGKWVLHALEGLALDSAGRDPLQPLLERAGFKSP